MANELYHHGIKGQRWGVRRFQSYDTVPRKSGKTGERTSDELLQEALVKQKEAQTQTHKKKKFLFF